jgi:hypothetical protein
MWKPLLLGLGLLFISQPVLAAPNAADMFNERWQRHDQLVQNGQASRSWTWGPTPITQVLQEYDQSRIRDVIYYDKGRMEINNIDGDTNDLWYVTSGRLPVDLMLAPTDWRSMTGWRDAYITAIGDQGQFPTYLDLQPLYESPGQPRPERLNQPATDLLEPDLRITEFDTYKSDPATILRQGENAHLVPQAFLNFMNQQGPTLRNGQRVNGRIYDPTYIFGLPVTPAVWVRAQVAGVMRPVLFQVFERRVLTYNPANEAAFQVEMGNVGAHYYDWLTNPNSGREFVYENSDLTTFVSARDPNVIYTLEVDIDLISLPPGGTPNITDSASYRIYQSLDGGQSRELRSVGKIGPGCWSILRVALLAPRSPQANPNRIGLYTACAQNPSAARGSNTKIYSSYDGGKTFFLRGGD